MNLVKRPVECDETVHSFVNSINQPYFRKALLITTEDRRCEVGEDRHLFLCRYLSVDTASIQR